MKKILLSISLMATAFVNAQIKSGTIKYELVTSLGNKMASTGDNQIPEALLAMIPKEIKNNMQLRFTETKSIYEAPPVLKKENEEDEPQDMGNGTTMKVMFKGGGTSSKDKVYTDFSTNKKIDQKEFWGKVFLVETDSINKKVWKPTGKQKLILNYPCYEALTTAEVNNKIDSITAWYTPAIATKSGPMGLCNLPGMILQVQIGKMTTVTATEVMEQEIKDSQIEKPKEGKKVTDAEYKEIMDKKNKEMGIEKGKPRVIMHTMQD